VLRAREVDQVDRVDRDRPDPELLAPGAKGLEVGRVVIGEAPGARALHEELHRVHSELLGSVERLLDPARAVAAKQHAITIAACLSASASLRARPATCTSAGLARRSSTG